MKLWPLVDGRMNSRGRLSANPRGTSGQRGSVFGVGANGLVKRPPRLWAARGATRFRLNVADPGQCSRVGNVLQRACGISRRPRHFCSRQQRPPKSIRASCMRGESAGVARERFSLANPARPETHDLRPRSGQLQPTRDNVIGVVKLRIQFLRISTFNAAMLAALWNFAWPKSCPGIVASASKVGRC